MPGEHDPLNVAKQPWANQELYDTLVEADGPVETKPVRLPTADDAEPRVSEYRDYNPEDTRVITCSIGVSLYPKDPYFNSRAEAQAWVTQEHGRILGANYVPGRAFFRVMRQK